VFAVGNYNINPYVRIAWNHHWENSTVLERSIYDHEIIYIDKGKMKLTIKNKVHIAEEGSCIVIPPDMPHILEGCDTDIWQPHVHFDFYEEKNSREVPVSTKLRSQMTDTELTYFRENFFQKHNIQIPYVVKLHDPIKIKKILFNIIREYMFQTTYSELALKGLVVDLVVAILNDIYIDDLKIVPQHENIFLLISHVMEHLEHNFTLQELAKIANMTPWSLIQTFNKLYNTSPKKYFDKFRLIHAKNLLQYSNYSVKEVAYQLEFESPQTFSRWFKNIDGKSPSYYKT